MAFNKQDPPVAFSQLVHVLACPQTVCLFYLLLVHIMLLHAHNVHVTLAWYDGLVCHALHHA